MKNKSIKHWIVVILLCFLAASSIGLCVNAVGVFYTPVSQSLGVLRGTFALHATLSSFATAITSLFVPKWMKKYPYKALLIIGVALAGISTFLMAFSNSIYLFYVLGIARGIGVGIYAMVPLTMIITNWFVEKHGLATSLALSFSGLSGAIFSPILAKWIASNGWQSAYMLQAICIVVLTLPAILYPWTVKPEDSNLLPYGQGETAERKAVLQSGSFRYWTLSFVCMGLFTVLHTSITGISQHMTGIATSIGLEATIGATMMSMTMVGNITTKLIIGFISDILNPLRASIIMIVTNMVSLFLLFFGMSTANPFVLLASSFIFGSIYSVGAVGIPLLTKYFFGPENYAQAYTKIGFITNIGSASSLTLIGYMYDFTHGYTLVLWIAIGMHICNLLMLWIIAHRYRKDYAK